MLCVVVLVVICCKRRERRDIDEVRAVPYFQKTTAKIECEGKAENEVCAICLCKYCLRSFQLGQTLRELHCKHQYHEECITPWVALRSLDAACPLCHRSVV